MPFTIRKKFKAEYAHQLETAFSSACYETIHGHSAVIELLIQSNRLNSDGMIIDFGEIKSYVTEIIDQFDHALIMPLSMLQKHYDYFEALEKHNKKLMLFPSNPTAENMAKFICKQIRRAIDKNWKNAYYANLTVRFHETETGWAEYTE